MTQHAGSAVSTPNQGLPRPAWAGPLLGALVLTGLAGCAATGPNSPQARPVIYTASTPTAAQQQQQQVAIDDCNLRAAGQGLTPDEKHNEAGTQAAKGAAVGGVGAAVGALVSGRNFDGVVRAGAQGAAVGGAMGGVSGAMNERPSQTYRNYVARCLGDKGLQVIGWN
jgi:outer membrane lipoprotein SlyB